VRRAALPCWIEAATARAKETAAGIEEKARKVGKALSAYLHR